MAIQFFESRPQNPTTPRLSLVLPEGACRGVLQSLDGLARLLVRARVTANAITSMCIALGAMAGALLAFGQFGYAAVAMVLASLGDAIDGMVARRSGSVSVGGALLDATGDRYQEFFFFGGLAICVHESIAALVVVLFAVAGSFMVSYSSAKAEALGMPVPPGVMRRPERAVLLCVGTAVMKPWIWAVGRFGLPRSADALPILLVAALIAVVANGSAIHRLRLLSKLSMRPEITRKAPPSGTLVAGATNGDPAPVSSPRRPPRDSGAHEQLL
jgi:CDP-diacylglycerol--glycerol-3-phosphate 3-phosphatidyltransferase